MNTLYKSVLIIGLSIIGLTAAAQQDSALIRQVLLEREYNPTLKEASRISTSPYIYTPNVQGKEFKYLSTAPQLKINNQLGSVESGDINTDVAFSKKRGYLNFGFGSHSNIEGAAGYRIINSAKDRLDIFANHSSTNGTVDFIEDYPREDAKAKYSASNVNMKYQHTAEPLIFSLDASFFNTSYNYYGNDENIWIGTPPEYDYLSRQNVDIFNIGTGIRSNEDYDSELQYDGSIRYRYFKSKYGPASTENAPKGGQLDLDLHFYTELGADRYVGVKAAVMNESFGNDELVENAYHNLTNVRGTPYIKFQGSSWSAELGINLDAMFDVKTKLVYSPNIKAEARVYDVNVFYAEITGGANNNTYLDILQENRYFNPAQRIEYSKTLFDIKGGFKSGVVDGFEFDLFAGYKKTDKDHLYIYGSTDLWASVSDPIYADVSTGHFGGALKTNLIPATDLSARITGYFYDVKYVKGTINSPMADIIEEKKAWGRPTFTAELNADVKPIEHLTLSFNYLFAGGRKAYAMGERKMKDINELNIRGEYQIADWLSVNARVNNLFSQKYELQHGYPLQGINVLGGVGFKF